MALPRLLLCLSCLLPVLAACSTPPGLEAGAPLATSDEPVALLPLDEILAQAEGAVASDETAAALAARAAALRAKASAN